MLCLDDTDELLAQPIAEYRMCFVSCRRGRTLADELRGMRVGFVLFVEDREKGISSKQSE